MVETAGFDIVIEIARGLIEDEIRSTALPPDGDTLAPPFTMSRNVTIFNQSVPIQFIVRAVHLRAGPGDTGLTVRFGFTDGSIESSWLAQGNLAGFFEVASQFRFAYSTATNLDSLGIELGTATVPGFSFDSDSRSLLSAHLPANAVSTVEDEIRKQLQEQFRLLPRLEIGSLAFRRAFGDSDRLLSLATVPRVRWIDGDTLGIFGMHRAGVEGNPSLKQASDLTGAVRREMAVLLSPDGFRLTFARDAVLSYVRDELAAPIRATFLAEERAKNGNTGEATPAENAAADERVRAHFELPENRALVLASTPPPFGTGSLHLDVKMPNPFSNVGGSLKHLDVSLGQGTIDNFAFVTAEVFYGTIKVGQRQHSAPKIDYGRLMLDKLKKDEPEVETPANLLCVLAAAVIPGPLLGYGIAVVYTYIAAAIVEAIAAHLLGRVLMEKESTPVGGIPDPLGGQVQWRDVAVAPTGLLLRGQRLGGVVDPVAFRPRVEIETSTKNDPISGEFYIAHGTADRLTGVVCVPATHTTFTFSRQLRDQVHRVGLVDRDTPRPLRVIGWSVEVGHKSDNRDVLWDPIVFPPIREFQALASLPYPPLVEGELIVASDVWDPEPPLAGAIVHREALTIAVAREGTGFVLKTRSDDLCYWLRLRALVVDAGGSMWFPVALLPVQGKVVTPGRDALDFIKSCDDQLRAMNDYYAKQKGVGPWDTQTGFRDRVVQSIRDDIRFGRTGVIAVLRQSAEAEGPQVLEAVAASLTR
jgi:hypothetical protein